MKEQQIDLLNISEREALAYLDQLTEKGLDKQSASVALFSVKKLISALDELEELRSDLCKHLGEEIKEIQEET